MTKLKRFVGCSVSSARGLGSVPSIKRRAAQCIGATVAFDTFSGKAHAASEAPSRPAALEQSGSLFMTELGVVVLIAACAWVAFSVWRKRSGHGAGGAVGDTLKVISGVMVGQRERVVILRARNRFFLLGVTPQNVTRIAEFDSAPEAEAWLAAEAESKSALQGIGNVAER